jgi:tetratricopeptide (TPR) repeat protein
MTTTHPLKPLQVILGIAVCMCIAFGVCGPSRAAEPAASPQAKSPGADKRRQALNGLYVQLSHAEDEQSAALVVSAIESLWLKSGSHTIDVLMSRAIVLVQDKEYDIALRILDTVVEIEPGFSEGWNQRATVHFLQRNMQDSFNDLRRVLALEPKHFKAVNGLGLVLEELGDKKAALKAYRQALKLNPFLGGTKRSIRELERDVEGQGI